MTRIPAGPASTAAALTWGAIAGPALGRDDVERLRLGLGGIVLFDANVESPEQLRALTAAIRAAGAGPVRISVDQEGGHIVRIGEPLTRFPGPMAVAATGSLRLTRAVAAASARELRSVGIDTVLAPVLDVAAVPENPAVGARAFGDRPAAVARLGAAAVRGYLDGGVLPVPKHLPGHGRTAEDSHLARPLVGGSPGDLRRVDLPPFEAAIEAGVPTLMVGHVRYAALDPDRPASLSPAASRLARTELGFDGLLVTDALVMEAVTGHVPLEESGVLAILAGMDAVMAIEGQRRVLAGLAAAIEARRIPAARLREALHRATELDRRFTTLPGRPLGEPLPADVMAAHAGLAAEVARRSLTLVADPHGLLPLDCGGSRVIVDVAPGRRSPIESETGHPDGTAERLARLLGRSLVASVDPAEEAGLAALVGAIAEGSFDTVVLLTRDTFATAASGLAARIAASGADLVHVAMRNPLDLVDAGGSDALRVARIAAYAESPATVDALADALSGSVPFRGHLPVNLPGVGAGPRTGGAWHAAPSLLPA